MVELFANSGDPDQTPHFATSDLGLRCLPITLLGVSRLQLIKLVLLAQKLNLNFRLMIFYYTFNKEISTQVITALDSPLSGNTFI